MTWLLQLLTKLDEWRKWRYLKRHHPALYQFLREEE